MNPVSKARCNNNINWTFSHIKCIYIWIHLALFCIVRIAWGWQRWILQESLCSSRVMEITFSSPESGLMSIYFPTFAKHSDTLSFPMRELMHTYCQSYTMSHIWIKPVLFCCNYLIFIWLIFNERNIDYFLLLIVYYFSVNLSHTIKHWILRTQWPMYLLTTANHIKGVPLPLPSIWRLILNCI